MFVCDNILIEQNNVVVMIRKNTMFYDFEKFIIYSTAFKCT